MTWIKCTFSVDIKRKLDLFIIIINSPLSQMKHRVVNLDFRFRFAILFPVGAYK